MSVKERIKEFISYKKLNVSSFEKQIGLSNGYVNSIVNTISPKKLEEICNVFPDLNKTWVTYGEGDMLLGLSREEKIKANAIQVFDEEGQELELIKKEDSTEFRRLGDDHYLVISPLVSEYAYAGYLSGWSDPQYLEELPRHAIVTKDLSIGVYRSFEVKGDSMDNGMRNSIAQGDIVTGRKLYQKYWKSKLHLHQYKNFVLITNDGIVIKQIIEHRVEEGIVVCQSLNPDKKTYPDFELHLRDVKEIFYVKATTHPSE